MRFPFRRRRPVSRRLPDWPRLPALTLVTERRAPILSPFLTGPDVAGTQRLLDRPDGNPPVESPRGVVPGVARRRVVIEPPPLEPPRRSLLRRRDVEAPATVGSPAEPRRAARPVREQRREQVSLTAVTPAAVGPAQEPEEPFRSIGPFERLLAEYEAQHTLGLARFTGFSSVASAPPAALPTEPPAPRAAQVQRRTLAQSRREGLRAPDVARPASDEVPAEPEAETLPDTPGAAPRTEPIGPADRPWSTASRPAASQESTDGPQPAPPMSAASHPGASRPNEPIQPPAAPGTAVPARSADVTQVQAVAGPPGPGRPADHGGHSSQATPPRREPALDLRPAASLVTNDPHQPGGLRVENASGFGPRASASNGPGDATRLGAPASTPARSVDLTGVGTSVSTPAGPEDATRFGTSVSTSAGPEDATRFGTSVSTSAGPEDATRFGTTVSTSAGPGDLSGVGTTESTTADPGDVTRFGAPVSTSAGPGDATRTGPMESTSADPGAMTRVDPMESTPAPSAGATGVRRPESVRARWRTGVDGTDATDAELPAVPGAGTSRGRPVHVTGAGLPGMTRAGSSDATGSRWTVQPVADQPPATWSTAERVGDGSTPAPEETGVDRSSSWRPSPPEPGDATVRASWPALRPEADAGGRREPEPLFPRAGSLLRHRPVRPGGAKWLPWAPSVPDRPDRAGAATALVHRPMAPAAPSSYDDEADDLGEAGPMVLGEEAYEPESWSLDQYAGDVATPATIQDGVLLERSPDADRPPGEVRERLERLEEAVDRIRQSEHPADPEDPDLFVRLDDPGLMAWLAERLYPAVRRRLRGELLIDRERRGVLADPR